MALTTFAEFLTPFLHNFTQVALVGSDQKTKDTSMKTYSFTDLTGKTHSFETYLAFSTWFFSIPRRIAVATFAPAEFKRMNRAALSNR